MAQIYLDELSAIIAGATRDRFPDAALTCKHFFSGAALYVDGKICVSLTPVGLALKLPEDDRNVLIENHSAKPLRYFPKGPIKKDYVVLPKAVLNDIKALRNWVKASIEYVVSLPLPAKGSRK